MCAVTELSFSGRSAGGTCPRRPPGHAVDEPVGHQSHDERSGEEQQDAQRSGKEDFRVLADQIGDV
jgi:hypothetical protein